jgi:hypothetical protein
MGHITVVRSGQQQPSCAAAMPPEYRALLPPLPRRPGLSQAALRALHATLLGRLPVVEELGTALGAAWRNQPAASSMMESTRAP